MTQARIEKAAGIDASLAEALNRSRSRKADQVRSLLKMCVDRFEQAAFGLLCAAVADFRKDSK